MITIIIIISIQSRFNCYDSSASCACATKCRPQRLDSRKRIFRPPKNLFFLSLSVVCPSGQLYGPQDLHSTDCVRDLRALVLRHLFSLLCPTQHSRLSSAYIVQCLPEKWKNLKLPPQS